MSAASAITPTSASTSNLHLAPAPAALPSLPQQPPPRAKPRSTAPSRRNRDAVAAPSSAHTLHITDDLQVICFRRNGMKRSDGSAPSRGPFFVVREWDSRVIRASKKRGGDGTVSQKARPSTEQALRATVRQAILNMNLALEPANKSEIQYLKSIDVLGKRAPSCSLLNVRDMLKLLYCFDKKRHAEELKQALRNEEQLDSDDDDPSVLITRINAKVAPKPITLRATIKTPINPSAFSIRTNEVVLPKGAALTLMKKIRAGALLEPSVTERKRKVVPTTPSELARATAEAAAGLGVEGLNALLNALRKPEETKQQEASSSFHVTQPSATSNSPMAAAAASSSASTAAASSSDAVVPPAKRQRLEPVSLPPLSTSLPHTAESPRFMLSSIPSPSATSSSLHMANSPLLPLSSYQSPALSFKRNGSLTHINILSPTHRDYRGASPSLPNSLNIPPHSATTAHSPSIMNHLSSPPAASTGASSSFYRHLLSPTPGQSPTNFYA